MSDPDRAVEAGEISVMRRRYADTQFGQIHLRLLACSEVQPAPALVCLHPLPYGGSYFETVAPLMSGSRAICAPDCPGYGGSDAPSRMLSMEEIATVLHEALATCGDAVPQPFDLLGFHSGCLLAVEMARLQPDRVRRMALIDVPYFTREEQAERYPKSTAARRYTPELSSLAAAWEFAVAKRLDGMPFQRAFGNFVELLRAGERANWGYHATLTYDCETRLKEVRHPTLVVATDSMLESATRKAASAIPGAVFVERKDVTRAVMEEGAHAIAEETLAFLD